MFWRIIIKELRSSYLNNSITILKRKIRERSMLHKINAFLDIHTVCFSILFAEYLKRIFVNTSLLNLYCIPLLSCLICFPSLLLTFIIYCNISYIITDFQALLFNEEYRNQNHIQMCNRETNLTLCLWSLLVGQLAKL